MAQLGKKTSNFAVRGMDLNASPDELRPGYFPYIENFRRLTAQSITPRHGLSGSRDLGATLHSLRRLNDSSSGTLQSTLVTGIGTALGICGTDLASSSTIDAGPFSGDPLRMCVHRPVESVKPFMYIGDRTRMRKTDVLGADKSVGLAPPRLMPTAALGQPQHKVVDDLDDHTGWTAAGTASAKANHTRVDSATRSITAIKYDSGTSGWACIRPSSMQDIGVGMRLSINAAETVVVQSVFRPSVSTTIASIIYESGSSGLCSIHLTTAAEEIEVDSMVLIAGAEYVRVLSVHRTKDGLTSFRCSTASTRSAGNSAVAVGSFRCYTTGTRSAGNTLGATGMEFQVTVGTGYVTKTSALDLSLIAAGLPTRPDDYMHVDIYVDKPELVSEIKLYLDIDGASNTFDRNYFMKVLRSNDLTPLTKDEQTLIETQRTREQRELLEGSETTFEDFSDLPRQFGDRRQQQLSRAGEGEVVQEVGKTREDEIRARQLNEGQNQWTSAMWRIGELLSEFGRVGSDRSRGLANVAALKLAIIATGTVTVRFDAWWIGGGYGPDVTADARDRIYRYRGRDSTTGVVSNWSPAALGGVRPRRQSVTVTLAQHSDAACDRLDVQVWGGKLSGWFFLGSTPNGASPTFTDSFSDSDLFPRSAISEQMNRNYQLWPQMRPPISGADLTISGNLARIDDLGIELDLSLAPGTAIRAGGQEYTIHSVLDVARVYLVESGGNQSSVDWEIPQPVLQGQPLAGLAGPFVGFAFGWGDKYNPWRLYYSNGEDFDSTALDHYVDVESETLMGLVILEAVGRTVLWSTNRAFSVEPSFTLASQGGNLFAPREIPDAGGLFAPWACCDADGEAIWLRNDCSGIYATSGGRTYCVSDDIRPIFPQGATPGQTINGVVGVDATAAQTMFFIDYAHGQLFFSYLGIDGFGHTLVNERDPQSGEWLGWIRHKYPSSTRPTRHYGEEGAGVIYLDAAAGNFIKRFVADTGDSAAFDAIIETPHETAGDADARKRFVDCILEYDRDGGSINVEPITNHTNTLVSTTISTGSGKAQKIIELETEGTLAKNLALRITAGSITTQRPVLYKWRYVATSVRPDTSGMRTTDYEFRGDGVTFARGVWIMADTFGEARSVDFEYTKDDGTTSTINLTVTHATMLEKFYPLSTGLYIIGARLSLDDLLTWEVASFRVEGDPAPKKSTDASPWMHPAGDGNIGARYVQGVVVDVDTEGANVNLQVQVDQNSVQTTIQSGANSGPVNANGRAQLAFSFDTPFITHMIRLIPSAACRIFGVKWISEPEPESAYMWWAQQTDCGIPGFKIFGDGYITVRSTGTFVLEFDIDGTTYTAVFYDASNNTSGERRRLRFRLPRAKGKVIRPKLYGSVAATRIAVYQKEFALQTKEWGSEGSWQEVNLLGDLHFEKGAAI